MNTKLFAFVFITLLVTSIATVVALERKSSDFKEVLDSNDVKRVSDLETDIIKSIAPDQETAKSRVEESVRRNRFILWTHDGANVLWGFYGNNFFYGNDNHGGSVWGIYYKGYFAGFHDGEFFIGKYSRNRWKAEGLYGEYNYGGFKTFPDRTAEPTPEPEPKPRPNPKISDVKQIRPLHNARALDVKE